MGPLVIINLVIFTSTLKFWSLVGFSMETFRCLTAMRTDWRIGWNHEKGMR